MSALAVVCVLACDDGAGGGADSVEPDAAGQVSCAFDDSEDAASAVDLGAGDDAEGFLCPVGDEDWFRVELRQAALLTVGLEMDAPVTPVQATYAIHADTGGAAGMVVARADAERVGQGGPADAIHCLPAGTYLVAVRDQGNDQQDLRHRYALSVETRAEPDANEPNNAADAATPLAVGATGRGRIACVGDTDVFAVDVPAGQVLDLAVAAPAGGLQLTVRVNGPDGTQLFEASNPAGANEPTAITTAIVARSPGQYTIAVGDDDDRDADPDLEYTVGVSLTEDLDPAEPNENPREATPLDARSCNDDWSEVVTHRGTFSAPGDVDWFRLPLAACQRNSVIEVELEMDTGGLSDAEAWALQSEVQAAVSLVRGHPQSPCSRDEECSLLTHQCQNDWGCAGLFNNCIDGRCAGATACLPEARGDTEGMCGAFIVERHYTAAEVPGSPDGPPPPNRAVVSSALPRQDFVYIRASDFRGDGAAPDVFYTLRARVIRDADTHEPSDVYAPRRMASDPVNVQLDLVKQQPPLSVFDCDGAQGGFPVELTGGVGDAGIVPDAGEPDRDAAQPAQDAAQPEPDAAPPEPDAAAPEPDAARPEPDAARPEPDAARPEPDAGIVDLDAAGPDATTPTADAGPAVDADVSDDAGIPLLVTGCCGPPGSGNWIEGTIGWEGDQDWYVYRHPCPGQDCMVRVLYEVEEGPVDHVIQVYRGRDLWFTALANDEAETQGAVSGALGGLEAADRCFYAYQGHNGNPYHYAIQVRDIADVPDWSPEQRYRFCVEKLADGCVEPPCQLFDPGGCDVPQQQ